MAESNDFVIKDKRFSAGYERDKDEQSSKKPEAPVKVDDKQGSKKAEPPPITFSTFVLSLSSSAAMNLGGYQDPVSGHVPKDLGMAKQSIDILGIIQEKTKGNLNDEEKELLDSALYELRMRYVEETKKGK